MNHILPREYTVTLQILQDKVMISNDILVFNVKSDPWRVVQ